ARSSTGSPLLRPSAAARIPTTPLLEGSDPVSRSDQRLLYPQLCIGPNSCITRVTGVSAVMTILLRCRDAGYPFVNGLHCTKIALADQILIVAERHRVNRGNIFVSVH